MSIDLQLPSGIVFRDAPGMLNAKFKEWAWKNYDGDKIIDSNRIGLEDIDRVYQLGARTPRMAYEAFLREHGDSVSDYLNKIPIIALEESCLADIQKELIGLFDLLLNTKFIKLAGATKLLSPLRPALLPVIDSVVESYYWYATSIKNEDSFRNLQRTFAAGTWGEYVFTLLELLRDDVCGARAGIDAVCRACTGEPFANASRVRIVESLIWFYYARGGSASLDIEQRDQ